METKALQLIKKELSANKNKISEVEIYICQVRENGKEGYIVYMGDRKLTDILSLPYYVEGFLNNLVRKLQELKKERGWKNLVWEKEEINLSSSIWRTNNITYPKRIMLMPKPCEEFTKLTKYIKKYTNKDILIEDLYSVGISGKRGRIYGEDGSRRYLAYFPNICSKILEELKKNRGSKDKVIIGNKDVIDDIDPFDRQSSIRYEIEMYGSRYTKYIVTIVTPSGKQKASINISF